MHSPHPPQAGTPGLAARGPFSYPPPTPHGPQQHPCVRSAAKIVRQMKPRRSIGYRSLPWPLEAIGSAASKSISTRKLSRIQKINLIGKVGDNVGRLETLAAQKKMGFVA